MAAWLRVAPELLAEILFKDCDKHPRIVSADWNVCEKCVLLQLDGDGIPEDAKFVTAEFTERTRMTVEFQKLDK
jgi:hypothetical protein